MTAQAAVALMNSRYVEEMEKRQAQEREFLDLVSDITSELDLNALLAGAGHKPVMSSANVAATFLPDGVLSGPASSEPWLLVTETCLSEAGTPVLSARDYHRGSQISFNFSRQ